MNESACMALRMRIHAKNETQISRIQIAREHAVLLAQIVIPKVVQNHENTIQDFRLIEWGSMKSTCS